MAVTLRDIAERVGLSPAVISRVLNNRPGVWVSEDNRLRILKAAEEMGYRPAAAARSLRSGCTYTVAFLLVQRPGLPGVLQAWEYGPELERLASGLAEKGYSLLVRMTGPASAGEAVSELAASRSCDALAVWGTETDLHTHADVLDSLAIPFAVKGRHESCHPHWPQVDYDHEGMMEAAVEKMRSAGRKGIAYLGFPYDETYAKGLLRGYLRATADPPEAWVSDRGETVQAAYRQVSDWMDAPSRERPTGIAIGAANAAWHGAERALHERGIRIGDGDDEVSVAGQTGTELTLWEGRGWRFTDLMPGNMGERMAAELLLPALADQPVERPVLRILPQLVPTDDPVLASDA
jgi:DNA-binding LacI/PurR family transcriptional regulator